MSTASSAIVSRTRRLPPRAWRSLQIRTQAQSEQLKPDAAKSLQIRAQAKSERKRAPANTPPPPKPIAPDNPPPEAKYECNDDYRVCLEQSDIKELTADAKWKSRNAWLQCQKKCDPRRQTPKRQIGLIPAQMQGQIDRTLRKVLELAPDAPLPRKPSNRIGALQLAYESAAGQNELGREMTRLDWQPMTEYALRNRFPLDRLLEQTYNDMRGILEDVSSEAEVIEERINDPERISDIIRRSQRVTRKTSEFGLLIRQMTDALYYAEVAYPSTQTYVREMLNLLQSNVDALRKIIQNLCDEVLPKHSTQLKAKNDQQQMPAQTYTEFRRLYEHGQVVCENLHLSLWTMERMIQKRPDERRFSNRSRREEVDGNEDGNEDGKEYGKEDGNGDQDGKEDESKSQNKRPTSRFQSSSRSNHEATPRPNAPIQRPLFDDSEPM